MAKKLDSWKIIRSKYLLSNAYIRVRVDQRYSPDLGEYEYYLLEFPEWANIVAVTDEGEFLLIRQFRHGMNIINLEIPGGVVDDGEEPRAAALRELQEETGYAAGEITLLRRISVNPAIQNNWCHLFLATGCRKVSEQKLDAAENIAVELVTREKLEQLLEQGAIHHSLNVVALILALKELN